MSEDEGIAMNGSTQHFGMGWLADYPDLRDYSVDQGEVTPRLKQAGQKDSIKAMLRKAGVTSRSRAKLPAKTDLRPWCSGIEDQGTLGSCTAQAGVSLVEFFENKAFGKHIDASRLFVYKATRNLMHWTGDTGAYLRTTMGALTLFGVPPEEYWPYNTSDFDKEPPSFCYAFAQNYQAIAYYRFDPIGTAADALLDRIKQLLSSQLPCMFGFTVYSSISQAATTGKIPFPTPNERVQGGHAIVAVGYDDGMKIKNTNAGGVETTGALLIRNSWGTGHGSLQGLTT